MRNKKMDKIFNKEFPGPERRKFPRIREALVFRYSVVSGKDKKVHSNARVAETNDISVGGLSFKTNELIVDGLHISSETTSRGPLRNSLVLQFQLPGSSHNIRASAEVAWYEALRTGPNPTYAVGVKFTNMVPEDRESIKKYVARIIGDKAPLKM